jgi:UDP-N-acetylmuramate: L-alanyl-gamma-D-glutamyl-meso-diaminopimelate ligase
LRLARSIADQGKRADALGSIDAIVDAIAAEATDGDTVAMLSNGMFGNIHRKLLDALGLPRPAN